jgi:GTP-binding protein
MKGEKRKQVILYTEDMLHFCSKFAKIIPCSALTRDGLLKLFDQVEAVQLSRTRHISTRELHRWFEQNVHGRPLGEVARAKHLTQTKDIPPTFVLFVKRTKSVNVTQLRYLENSLRKTFGFDGTPIRWVLKGEEEEEKKRKIK